MATAITALAGNHDRGAKQHIIVSPRVEARLDDKQLVLIYANPQLYEDKPLFNKGGKKPKKLADPRVVVFLESFIDGTPTTGAKIALNVDSLPYTLTETGPGVYQSEKVVLGGGRNEIELAYEIGAESGSLDLMLVIPAGASSSASDLATPVPPATVPGWVYVIIGLAIYLGITGLFWLRRRATADTTHSGDPARHSD